MLHASRFSRRPLYFVKLDLQGCFDSIDRDKLFEIVQGLVSKVRESRDFVHTASLAAPGSVIAWVGGERGWLIPGCGGGEGQADPWGGGGEGQADPWGGGGQSEGLTDPLPGNIVCFRLSGDDDT